MKPHLKMRIDWDRFELALTLPERIMVERHHIQAVWELVSKPLKFPARRRRSDREIPKAA
jgi:hypothetical protein